MQGNTADHGQRTRDIYASFRRTTGHQHPHFDPALQQYAAMLRATERAPAEIDAVLEELRR